MRRMKPADWSYGALLRRATRHIAREPAATGVARAGAVPRAPEVEAPAARFRFHAASDAGVVALRADSVRHALEELYWLDSSCTARLERRLVAATLLVGAGRRERPDGTSRLGLIEDGSEEAPRLAIFTGVDRLLAYGGTHDLHLCPARGRDLWPLVTALGYGDAVLDPGHVHAAGLSRWHLKRLALRARGDAPG